MNRLVPTAAFAVCLLFTAGVFRPAFADEHEKKVGEIVERVAEVLSDSGLDERQKERVLQNLKRSLAAAEREQKEAREPERPGRDAEKEADERRAETRADDRREAAPRQRGRRGDEVDRRRDDDPQVEALRRMREAAAMSGRPFALGIVVETHEEDAEGLVVREVVPDSPADDLGLREGDVIVKIDEEAVSEPMEMIRRVQMAGMRGRTLDLEVRRDDETLNFKARPGFGPPDMRPFSRMPRGQFPGPGFRGGPFPPSDRDVRGRGPRDERRGPREVPQRRAAPDERVDELSEQLEELRQQLQELREMVREPRGRDRRERRD